MFRKLRREIRLAVQVAKFPGMGFFLRHHATGQFKKIGAQVNMAGDVPTGLFKHVPIGDLDSGERRRRRICAREIGGGQAQCD